MDRCCGAPQVTKRPPPTNWDLWERIHHHSFCVVPVMKGYGQLRASGRQIPGVNTQYLGITQDETMAVEVSPHQFNTCQEANGQFCDVITPFSTTCESTILHHSFIHQDPTQHFGKVFTMNKENS